MNKTATKLIIIRGPSGSGKSTVAQLLFKNAKRKTCLIEQDYYRFIFKPVGAGGKPNSHTVHQMIKSNVLIALRDGYNVILEGILSVKSYSKVLDEIFAEHKEENYIFYFDISFEETVKRHHTKPANKKEGFDEEDMKTWYPKAHKSDHELEVIIPESLSAKESVEFISKTSNL